MDELQKQVRRAARRLAAERFASVLGWCLTIAISLAAAIILAGKFLPVGLSNFSWILLAVAAGFAAAAVYSFATAGKGLAAAIEIDRRCKLKERVSSALSLSPEERETEAGRALVADAVRRVKRIDVSAQFKPRPARSLLYPLAPALLAFLIAIFVSSAAADKTQAAAAQEAAVAAQVKKSAHTLEKKFENKKLAAKEKGLKEAEDVFKLLAQDAKKLGEADKADRQKTLVKLNDLDEQLKKRRQETGEAEKVKQQLGNLKGFKQGPADDFAKAVRHGDFQKAMNELDKLQERLKGGNLDEKERQKLAEQLDQMRDKLAKMNDAQKAAENDLKKKIEELQKKGDAKEADKLQQQLDKLRMNAPPLPGMDNLAQQMQQCAKCLKEGDMQNAAKALGAAGKDLQDLQKKLEEMEMLDEAMEQLQQCRDAMCCKQCQGDGCKLCQGAGVGGSKAGVGIGPGQGKESKIIDASFHDSQVKQQVGRGAMSLDGYVEGPNKKGEVGEEIKKQLDAAKHSDTDPLTGRQIPKKHRESVNGYFSRLRGGEK